jgi:hypothetical protein
MQFAIQNNDGNWRVCKSLMNRGNCRFPTKDCLNHRIYFGFRNNNISQDLDVKLEVIAIVDTAKGSTKTYSYTLLNGTNNELKFYTNYNDADWTLNSLRPNYQFTFSFEKPVVYVRIYTTAISFAHYKLTPGNRYKFIFNKQAKKWDVVYY